jgi:ArsR family transcriptional regulator
MSALSEPTRLGAIRILWDGDEHCACKLLRDLDADQSQMSWHMAVLKKAGLIVDRRDPQWVRYRRNPHLPRCLSTVVDAVLAALPQKDARPHEQGRADPGPIQAF